VSGISSYGNSVGVPTVGGETVFDACYAENPLVNVMCVGVMPRERLVLGRASGEGNLAVLLGSTTGRDGIGGVSVLASAGFGDDDSAKRPSVQVGDPFEEKRLIEACLALYDAGLVVGIQDLGGAGLTCATSETASRGGMGMDVDVDPARLPAPDDPGADVLALTADLSWVWTQYDHQLFLNTVEGPGGDAAVLRLKAPGLPATGRAIALSADGNARWCALDPRRGTALVVAEAALNVACAGARPVAIVNCLNFGNPEHPEVMW